MLARWPIAYVESEKQIAINRYGTRYGMNIHSHDYFEMEYIISGKCRQNFKRVSNEFSRGDVALFKVESRHEIYAYDEVEVFRVVIKPDFLPKIYEQYASEFKAEAIVRLPPNEISRVENLLFSIEKEFNAQNEFYMEAIAGYLEVLFTLLIRINHMNTKNEKTSSTIDYKLVLSYIEKNLRTVTPSSVAAYLGYNFPYFSKSFKRFFGKNLSEFINLKKLETAQKLLAETDKSIGVIGEEVGFNHKSYFHRIFKRYYGVTPEEYRKSNSDLKKK
ncbi:MAG: helix-turn-helix domain-containing protein [Ruminococcaceae bacterium]|nr:helix-turn-helix domain-containing protein [Oscillospiraceae bacterium]